MEIKISNLADGIHEYKFRETAGSLNLGEPFFGEVELSCKLDKSNLQLVLDATLTVNANFECDRCMEEYQEEITTNYEVVYMLDDQTELDDEDVIHLPMEADKISLDREVIDYSYLSLPMKRLCDDDCKGLCSRCGTNLNEKSCNCGDEEFNPIWEKLKELKDKQN